MTKKKRNIIDIHTGGWVDESIPDNKVRDVLIVYLDPEKIDKAIERIKTTIGYYRVMIEYKENEESQGEEVSRLEKISTLIIELNKQLKFYPEMAGAHAYYEFFKNVGGDWHDLLGSTQKSLNVIDSYSLIAKRELIDTPVNTKPSEYPRNRFICVLSRILSDYYIPGQTPDRIERNDFIKDILNIFVIDCPSDLDKIVRQNLS